MYPLVSAGDGKQKYRPYNLEDTEFIKSKLPPLEDGVHQWISKFVETFTGDGLTMGDWRKLFTACSSGTALHSVEREALTLTVSDEDELYEHRIWVWDAIRHCYPAKMDTTALNNMPLKDGETGTEYMSRFEQMWMNLLGADISWDQGSEAMFRGAVQNSLPLAIR